MTKTASTGAPAGKIEPQAWLTAPQARMVMKALEAEGGEARFVGGCVRDALLKRDVLDIDIATTEPPEKVKKLLEAAGIKVIPTGIAHGTVTALTGGAAFQITTLRIDAKTDGRRAKVIFTSDWEADAARRDFTINTMSCTLDGDVYDPLNGMKDLAERRVRFVGNASQRIGEDVLRLLRFFRIYDAYGAPPPDTCALAACRALAPRLVELSGERIRDEFLRILLGRNPAGAVLLMQGERVLDHILPEAGGVGKLRQLTWLESSAVKIGAIAPDALRRLAALIVDGSRAGGEAAARRLVLSGKQTSRLLAMLSPAFVLSPDMDQSKRRRALSRMGKAPFIDAVLLAWAKERSLSPRHSADRAEGWIGLAQAADSEMPEPFPLTGRDALALGVGEGPRIGGLLSSVLEWWEEGGCMARREECLEELKRRAGTLPSA